MDQPAIAVGAVIASSVVAALNALGRATSPPDLDWRFVRYPDAVVIEGRPTDAGGVLGCERWAEILGMSEYTCESQEMVRAWFLNDGEWSLEIIAEIPATVTLS